MARRDSYDIIALFRLFHGQGIAPRQFASVVIRKILEFLTEILRAFGLTFHPSLPGPGGRTQVKRIRHVLVTLNRQ